MSISIYLFFAIFLSFILSLFRSIFLYYSPLFFFFYFAMTGLHAVHMLVGLGLVSVILFQSWRGVFTEEYHAPVEVVGLYWHFVDIVWIFLFPIFYLIVKHH